MSDSHQDANKIKSSPSIAAANDEGDWFVEDTVQREPPPPPKAFLDSSSSSNSDSGDEALVGGSGTSHNSISSSSSTARTSSSKYSSPTTPHESRLHGTPNALPSAFSKSTGSLRVYGDRTDVLSALAHNTKPNEARIDGGSVRRDFEEFNNSEVGVEVGVGRDLLPSLRGDALPLPDANDDEDSTPSLLLTLAASAAEDDECGEDDEEKGLLMPLSPTTEVEGGLSSAFQRTPALSEDDYFPAAGSFESTGSASSEEYTRGGHGRDAYSVADEGAALIEGLAHRHADHAHHDDAHSNAYDGDNGVKHATTEEGRREQQSDGDADVEGPFDEPSTDVSGVAEVISSSTPLSGNNNDDDDDILDQIPVFDPSSIQLPDVDELRARGLLSGTSAGSDGRARSGSRSTTRSGGSGKHASSTSSTGSNSALKALTVEEVSEGPYSSLESDEAEGGNGRNDPFHPHIDDDDDITVYPHDELAASSFDTAQAVEEEARLRRAFESSASVGEIGGGLVLSAENLSLLQAQHESSSTAKPAAKTPSTTANATTTSSHTKLSEGEGQSSNQNKKDGDSDDAYNVVVQESVSPLIRFEARRKDDDASPLSLSLSSSSGGAEGQSPFQKGKSKSPRRKSSRSGSRQQAASEEKVENGDDGTQQQQQQPLPSLPLRPRVSWEDNVTQGSRHVMSSRNANRFVAPLGPSRTLPFVVPIKHVIEQLWREEAAVRKAAAAEGGVGVGVGGAEGSLLNLSVQQQLLLQQQRHLDGTSGLGGGGGQQPHQQQQQQVVMTANYQTVSREVSGDGTIYLRVQTIRPAPQFTDPERFKLLAHLLEMKQQKEGKGNDNATSTDGEQQKKPLTVPQLENKLRDRQDVHYPTLLAEWPHVTAAKEAERKQQAQQHNKSNSDGQTNLNNGSTTAVGGASNRVRSLLALLHPPRPPLIASEAGNKLTSYRATQHRVNFAYASSGNNNNSSLPFVCSPLPVGAVGLVPQTLPMPSSTRTRSLANEAERNVQPDQCEAENVSSLGVELGDETKGLKTDKGEEVEKDEEMAVGPRPRGKNGVKREREETAADEINQRSGIGVTPRMLSLGLLVV